MGTSNPMSSILAYKIDNEVGASLETTEVNGVKCVRLLSKEGNILSQQPLSQFGGSTLAEDLTPNVSLGGISAGVTIKAGTSLEMVIRQLLSIPDWYVGFATGLSKTGVLASTSDEIISYILGQFSKSSSSSYSYVPTAEKGVFFLLLKGDASDLEITLVPQGYEGLTSVWDYAALTKDGSDWFVGEDGISKTVEINGNVYTLYGYYNNEWSTEETTSTGTPDVLTVRIA